MTIRLEAIKGLGFLARVYDCVEPEPMAPYCATFVLEWQGPREVWIKGMHGRLTRHTLREIVAKLVEIGAHTVLAQRAEGRVLPCGVVGEDGVTRIRVADLANRFASKGASGWVDLEDAQRGGL